MDAPTYCTTQPPNADLIEKLMVQRNHGTGYGGHPFQIQRSGRIDFGLANACIKDKVS